MTKRAAAGGAPEHRSDPGLCDEHNASSEIASIQKADEYLREIKEQGMLGDAVRQCVEAAGHEQHTHTQKALLRAASFGKCFLTNLSPEAFVSVCRDLRVLNAVRDPSIGIPLTHTQYKQMTVQVLIDRLVYRRLYPLAIEAGVP
ncbi:unnamed protein product [Boreogadus saida]